MAKGDGRPDVKRRKAAMSPEELAEFRARQREATRAYRARRTPEQVKADIARVQEATQRRRANMTPEERTALNRRYSDNRRAKEAANAELREARLVVNRRLYAAARMTALVRYSSEIPSCACCGERELTFLVLDHINGGGSKHRKSINASNVYTWLKARGYPDGFRVLCANCNFAVRLGPCPHEQEKILMFRSSSGGCS